MVDGGSYSSPIFVNLMLIAHLFREVYQMRGLTSKHILYVQL